MFSLQWRGSDPILGWPIKMQPESGDATLREDQFEVALQQQQPTLIVYGHYIASPPHNEREDIGHWQLAAGTFAYFTRHTTIHTS